MVTESPSSSNTTDGMQGLKVIIVAAVILLVGSGVFFLNRSATQQQQQQPIVNQPSVSGPDAMASQGAIVYGTWERNNTVLHATTPDGKMDAVIARLPLDVKNIRPVSDTSFVYIAGVDTMDHGTSVVFYDVVAKQEQTVVTADPGWVIDSLIISPDKQYIAYWQVQFRPNTSILTGGNSRVYTASLGSFPATPNRIYDEVASANTPVHYPLFFDHAGRLYADGFTPNDDGWNRGLMRTDSMGSNPPEQVLAAGSYNADPVLSPTNNSIAYTSHDPSKGVLLQGKATSGVFSTEGLNPNTVNLLNLDTMVPQMLVAQGSRLYYDLTWRSDGSQLFIRSHGSDGAQLIDPIPLTVYMPAGTIEPLDGGNIIDGMILSFGTDGVVTGVPAGSGATGNLGGTYEPVLGGFAVNHGDSTVTTIPATNAQYIHTTTTRLPDTIIFEQRSPGKQTLQLQSFVLKPNIESRPAQQNDLPKNIPYDDQGRPQCKPLYLALTGQGNYSTTTTTTGNLTPPTNPGDMTNVTTTVGEDPTLQLGQFAPHTQVQQIVTTTNLLPTFKESRPILKAQYKCFDSPLYLYNARPLPVSATVTNATILESIPAYNPATGWNLYATPQGSKIDYNYAAPFSAPETGYVVSSGHLTAFLSQYAPKVGLNDRETADYLAFWSEQLPAADYYVVSHYDNPATIMNVELYPQPDTLIQVIMYFKPISAEEKEDYVSLTPPSFSPVPSRTGFTAVDWSGIIDR